MKELKDIKLHEIMDKREMTLEEIKDKVINLYATNKEFIDTIKFCRERAVETKESVLYDLAGEYSLLISDSRIHIIEYKNSFYYDEFLKETQEVK